jgi:hypothetical protein
VKYLCTWQVHVGQEISQRPAITLGERRWDGVTVIIFLKSFKRSGVSWLVKK